MASASTSRPSASVLPISTVMPFRLGEHVARPEGIAGDAVLGGGDQHAEPHRQLRAHDEEREGKRRGRAAHVLLHQRHGARRLDVEAAGIEADALADDRHLGRVLGAPAEIDQAGRAVARASHGVDHREIVGEQAGAFGDLDARAEGVGKLARRALELGGAEIVGRRVDEVAAEIERLGERQNLVLARAVGQHEAPRSCAPSADLVAGEAVAPGEEAERGKLGIGSGEAKR